MVSLYVDPNFSESTKALIPQLDWSSTSTSSPISAAISTVRTQKNLLETPSHVSQFYSSFQPSIKTMVPRNFRNENETPDTKLSLLDFTLFEKTNLKNGSLDLSFENYEHQWSNAKSSIVTKADLPKNNLVDLDRIALGLDTRTTLMLRNIPNKVDQQMLKEYVDVTNKNTYDFLCKLEIFLIVRF